MNAKNLLKGTFSLLQEKSRFKIADEIEYYIDFKECDLNFEAKVCSEE